MCFEKAEKFFRKIKNSTKVLIKCADIYIDRIVNNDHMLVSVVISRRRLPQKL